MKQVFKTVLAAAAGATAFAVLLPSAAHAQGMASSFGVQSTLSVAGVGVSFGPAPTSSVGDSPNSLASAAVPGIFSTGALTTTATEDGSGVLNSTATVNDTDLGIGISPASVGATATAISATCTADASGVSGDSTLAGLSVTVAGAAVTIPADPAPNTTISLTAPIIGTPLATLVLNEQTLNGDGSLTVNAFHLTLSPGLGTGEFIVSSATCGPFEAPIPVVPGGALAGTGLVVAAFAAAGLMLRRRQAGGA